MAWAFSLSAECGPDRTAAAEFSSHFQDISWQLSTGETSQLHTTLFQDLDQAWWCRICPSDTSTTGIESPDSAYSMTELGILLYRHLQSAPAFRYALVGVEVDEFRTHSELLDEPSTLQFPGLVLSDATWRSLSSPVTFHPFIPGYKWQPYEGEVYNPLMVSPTLKAQLNNLLAA